MKTISLIQGTPEWHAHRAKHWNASDAPAMMGCSPYMTRTELLNRLHTGITPEVGPETQRRFDDGHRFEALARPLAEAIIGEELYPVTGVEGRYSASFDGLTMLEDTAFEHKTLNVNLAELVWLEDANDFLPMQYLVQMEHQAMVSGCERILFMASKWRGDELVEERHCWYTPDAELRARIVAGWAQLEADLATYVPSTVTVAPVAKTVASLPVVFDMRVEGKLIACNLAQYKPAALAYIAAINTELETEQDFGDAEADAKFCRDSADKLKLAIEQALGQMGDINTALNTVKEIAAAFDAKGLMLEKLVKSRKDELRAAIVSNAVAGLQKHCIALEQRVGHGVRVGVPADFAGAIKGKRNLDSIQDAVDTVLAQAKIAASAQADLMEANIKTLRGEAHDWGFLFPDLATVASKPAEDFANLMAARIKTHQDAEATRKAREAEAAAQAAQVVEKAAAPLATAFDAAVEQTGDKIVAGSLRGCIKLGQINACLSPIQITQAGLSQLGFDPVGKDKAAVLYWESDFPAICQAIAKHAMGAVSLV